MFCAALAPSHTGSGAAFAAEPAVLAYDDVEAQIKDGSIEFDTPHAAMLFQKWKLGNDGARIKIEQVKSTRTLSQNAYYHVYLDVISRETGDNADDLHEFFKRKFLSPRFIKIQGEEVKIPGSTTELDKIEFGDYLDKICALTNIPLPDPEAAGVLTSLIYVFRRKIEPHPHAAHAARRHRPRAGGHHRSLWGGPAKPAMPDQAEPQTIRAPKAAGSEEDGEKGT